MYIAELQGKFSPREERMEDILTSNVFSFFKYAKREVFLYELLKFIGININSQELNKAEFIFWPSYEDGTEPDLVIVVGNHYLLFEAKLTSSFGEGEEISAYQLIREYNMGRKEAQRLKKEFLLIAVTAHFSEHQFLSDISGYFNHEIKWLNWHGIALLISNILESQIKIEVEYKFLANDLYALLLKKGLRHFGGLDVFHCLDFMQEQSSPVFFIAKTAQYRGDFIGFNESYDETPDLKYINQIFFIRDKDNFFSIPVREEIQSLKAPIFLGGKNE